MTEFYVYKNDYITMRAVLFESKAKKTFFLRGVFILYFTFFCSFSWAQQKICFGSIKNYGVDRSENLGLGTSGSVYNWQVRDSRFAGRMLYPYADRTNEISIDWADTPAGDYVLEVNELNSGCTSLNQMLRVTILPLPDINLTDQYLCYDPVTNELLNTVLLDTKLSGHSYSFKWEHDGVVLPDISSSIIVNRTGVYTVEAVNLLMGCAVDDTVIVGLSSSSVASVKVENIFMDLQNIIIVIEQGFGSYEYSIDGVIFQDEPFFSVSTPGVYQVVVRDKNGCNDIYLTANVIKYPKFFTPNNDSYNDMWMIDDLLPSMKPKICIFDRYGKMLKVINVNEQGWDGNYNGSPMPSDDYWFTIEYTNSEGLRSVFKSHFTLKR